MDIAVMLILSVGVGIGVVLTAAAARPRTLPLDRVFEAIDADTGVAFSQAEARSGASIIDALTRFATSVLGHDPGLERDLAVTGRTVEQHALSKITVPAIGVLSIYLMWSLLRVVGVDLPTLWVSIVAATGACAGFFGPDIRLRAAARARRVGFRHALSAYLDLVTVLMAGGGGILTALQGAADAGDGWAFAEIRTALDRARLSSRTPWSQLGELGERFDIAELRDLVSAADLAGSEGARLSESVGTKADVLRSRLQSEVEATSESLTEQMLIPVALLLLCLFMFIGFSVYVQIGGNDGFIDESPVTTSF